MTKPLLFLAALTLFCCIATMPAFVEGSCECIRYSTTPVPRRVIRRVVMIPVSGSCRRTEIIITKRTGQKVCAKAGVKWVDDLIGKLQKENEVSNETTVPPTASTTIESNF